MNDKCVVFNCTQECPLQWGYCNGKESGALRVLPFENDRKYAGGLHRNLICMLKGGWMSGTSGNHSVCKISERAIVEVLKHFKMLQEK